MKGTIPSFEGDEYNKYGNPIGISKNIEINIFNLVNNTLIIVVQNTHITITNKNKGYN